jgi:hypothetical protein
MKRRAERHRMNREQLIISEFERDHFEHVPGSVRPDCEDLRRIGIVVEIHNDDRMLCSVPISASRIPCRLADRWISTREYRNTYFGVTERPVQPRQWGDPRRSDGRRIHHNGVVGVRGNSKPATLERLDTVVLPPSPHRLSCIYRPRRRPRVRELQQRRRSCAHRPAPTTPTAPSEPTTADRTRTPAHFHGGDEHP